MTADLTAEQAAKLAEFEAAEDAPESIRERVARAMWEADFPDDECGCPDYWIDIYHGRADAAIAVLRGPATEADKAVERVLELCDVADDQPDGYDCEFISTKVIRAAIGGDS